MSKRRVFDIGFPGDEPATPPSVPAGAETPARRGPMASAISENADALRERAVVESRIRAENDTLAHEFVRLRTLGLLVDLIPLEAIQTGTLARDRAPGRDDDIDELKESIRAIGLSNPIRVVARGGHYELVQGYRRLQAYRELLADTQDTDRWARIPAGLVAPGETVQGLYRRMVDENLVRRDISFAEMAQVSRAYLDDPQTEAGSMEVAIGALFGSAARQKRIYIRQFAQMLDRMDGALRFAPDMPRALGLAVWKRLDRDPASADDLREALNREPDRDSDRELTILRAFAEGAGRGHTREKPRKPGAKTTLRVRHDGAIAQCTAADGRVELRLPRDFSTVDRMRLERAVAAFFAALDA